MAITGLKKVLGGSEGRYLSWYEQELVRTASLELPFRLAVSRAIQEREHQIISYATDAFCETMPQFDGPAGSMRRKKGHQDGRIMLRFIAQAIRDGSPADLYEKVLSWLVGHLDEHNVTGKHMEIFLHFILQGARRELPEEMHGMLDTTFAEVMGFIRRSSDSGTIHRAFRRISDRAVTRLLSISTEAKNRYGGTTQAKCRRDFELFVKEIARCLKADSSAQVQEKLVGWLIDRLVNQVEYPADVWHWSFLAINEAIVDCCGADVAASVEPYLQSLADNAEHLLEAVKIGEAAGKIADTTAEGLLDMGIPLGLYRVDEFKTSASMANRQLVTQLATLHAAGHLNHPERLAAIWLEEVLPALPATDTNLLAANLKALLGAASSVLGDEAAQPLRAAVMLLVDVAKRTELGDRLAVAADDLAGNTVHWLVGQQLIAASGVTACMRDLRLMIGKVIELLPQGQPSDNAYQLRDYAVTYLLPNQPSHFKLLAAAYGQLQVEVGEHLSNEDARVVLQYLEPLVECFQRFESYQSVLSGLDNFTELPVQRGYQVQPRHETLSRHGATAGRRDAFFLLQRVLHAAAVGGEQARDDLHKYFIHENVRFSGLPGGVIMEFIRGLQEQLLDHPDVTALLVDLARCAPLYSASYKIRRHSSEVATTVSEHYLRNHPEYAKNLKDNGLEACARDYGIMLRGLAANLQSEPHDVDRFKQWWMSRIGRNLHNKPVNYDQSYPWRVIDLKQLMMSWSSVLDQAELDAVEAYLKMVIGDDPARPISASNGRSFGAPVTMASGLTFSDVLT